MSLNGEIQTMPLPDLLQWLDCMRRTGVLTLTRAAEAHAFHLDEGQLVTTPTLGNEMATEAQIRRALAVVLPWDSGRFEFETGPVAAAITNTSTHLSGPAMVLDIFREIDESEAETPPRYDAEKEREALSAELRREVVAQLLDGNLKVPLLPTVIKKILDVTARDDYALTDLSDVIVSDQVVAARVLKQANSAFYGTRQEIGSLLAAVQRLGSDVVTNIVLSLSLQSMTQGGGRFLERKQRIWHLSLSSALFARSIGKLSKLDSELAFLCGLMSTFGKIVLLSVVEDVITSKDDFKNVSDDAIDEIVEAFHTNVGGMIGKTWCLPAAVQDTVRYRDDPALANIHAPYVACASLGDTLAAMFSDAGDSSAIDSIGMPAEDVAAMPSAVLLGLPEEKLERLLERAPEFMNFAKDFLA